MNLSAKKENARTLAALVGVDEEKATALLNFSVLMTFDKWDPVSKSVSEHLQTLLIRTVERVSHDQSELTDIAAEIVVGKERPRSNAPHIYVGLGNEVALVSFDRPNLPPGPVHPSLLLITACYTAAATLKAVLGELLPFKLPPCIKIDLRELVSNDLAFLYSPVDFGEAHLVGSGAIGNGFIYGLSQFIASGQLHVFDDDRISAGNLQRCVFFDESQLGLLKAEQLSITISKLLPDVEAIPHPLRLQDYDRRKGAWLKRLIVGVDSPRARRSLQSEIPNEVFDASTTGINEIVMHFHKQPTSGACLACVYHETPQEDAHAVHVADVLGVSLESVNEERISNEASTLILEKYPNLRRQELVGIPYDTLFKQLCSTAKLIGSEDKQVLAPFAFVSVLAGTLLALEFVRRVQGGHDGLFNEWRISPWTNPVFRRRRVLERYPSCEFCSNPILQRVASELWM